MPITKGGEIISFFSLFILKVMHMYQVTFLETDVTRYKKAEEKSSTLKIILIEYH
jgi:hypothetical protein